MNARTDEEAQRIISSFREGTDDAPADADIDKMQAMRERLLNRPAE